ncbi:hypothetical protein C2R22_10715 [Salinigranum rubrum]|uniref:SWIM-type domain-containing protein n=1 Tax=Salinigranum rubrum TaxID=755307 RepID=A0A2I8VJG5_9EURY|nr:hypothetical protein [Salinigranum rubrum]AUV82061.1 hypothetical protein C2R22_10715 [Salinigranum rubrum]
MSSEPLGGYPDVELPDGFASSTSWERAEREDADVSPVNRVEWMVRVGNGALHRVVFALDGGKPVGECDCLGYKNRGWCTHVAAMYQRYVRQEIEVADVSEPVEAENARLWVKYRRGGQA